MSKELLHRVADEIDEQFCGERVCSFEVSEFVRRFFEKERSGMNRTVQAIVRQRALRHIKPLRGAKLIEAHAVNRFSISVTFEHDGHTQTQLIFTGVPLPNAGGSSSERSEVNCSPLLGMDGG